MLVKPLVRSIVRSIAGVPTNSLGSGFSPTSLFLDGSKGVVYDNNDLSSFYLDSAGTTAATVNGLVGLQLDKSLAPIVARRNMLNYSEQFDNAAWSTSNLTSTPNTTTAPDGATTADTLTANGVSAAHTTLQVYAAGSARTFSCYFKAGTNNFVQLLFDGDAAPWANFNISSGVVGSTGSNQTATITDAGSGWYRCVLYTSSATASNPRIAIITSAASSRAESNTLTTTVIAWGAQLDIGASATEYQKVTTGNGDWMPGNHRYQTTTGSKPVLRGTPTGANLVTNGDFASGTGWTTGAGWAIGSGVATATTSSGTLTSTLAATASKNYRVTYTITRSAGSVQVSFGGRTGASRSAAGTYVDYLDSTTNTNALVFTGTTFSGTVDDVEVMDVSAGQVTAPYGLQYDGVDDFLQTAAVDFTATDKMFVCAGVRKLSDLPYGVIVESSATTTSNNGSFVLLSTRGGSPADPVPRYHAGLRGTAYAGYDLSTYTAPHTGVFAVGYDIAGATIAEEIVPRINGLSPTLSAVSPGPAGTGNFGNYALYFGRRGGTSLPYNGIDFGFVICGKTLTSTQISQTERYIAQRTGVTI